MGRFKIRSLSKSPRPRRNTDTEERVRETTEDSWKLVDYPTAMSESGERQLKMIFVRSLFYCTVIIVLLYCYSFGTLVSAIVDFYQETASLVSTQSGNETFRYPK